MTYLFNPPPGRFDLGPYLLPIAIAIALAIAYFLTSGGP